MPLPPNEPTRDDDRVSGVAPSRPARAPSGLAAPERPAWPAIRRGFVRRCPQCGQAPLFEGYLKVTDRCPVCATELMHHRADDGPAFLTILIVGHVMAPAFLLVYRSFTPEPLVMATIFTVFCVGLSLYLLPRLKGMIVGIQWAKRMHGFAATG